MWAWLASTLRECGLATNQAEHLFDEAGGDIDLLDDGERLLLSGFGRTWRGRGE